MRPLTLRTTRIARCGTVILRDCPAEQEYMIPIDNILARINGGKVDEIVEAHMTTAKRRRHVVKYTEYLFNQDVFVYGRKETKMLVLKWNAKFRNYCCPVNFLGWKKLGLTLLMRYKPF